MVGVKIIDGAEDVYSLRRKELYWQYRLETFSPKGLNERAADVELDMFAYGTAWVLPLHLNGVLGGFANVIFCFPLVTSCLSARGGRVEFPIGLSRIQNLLRLFIS